MTLTEKLPDTLFAVRFGYGANASNVAIWRNRKEAESDTRKRDYDYFGRGRQPGEKYQFHVSPIYTVQSGLEIKRLGVQDQ